MARDQMQDVILLEVIGLPTGAASTAEPGLDGVVEAPSRAGDRGRALRMRHWRPLAAGLAGLLVVGTAVAGVREQARATRLAAVPGVLAPLSSSLAELWRTPMRGWGELNTIGGDVVTFGRGDQGTASVEMVDGTTGARRWLAPLPEVTKTGDVWCVALGGPGPDRDARLACRLVGASVIDPEDGNFRPAGPAHLVVLDARTGKRLAERTMGGGSALLAAFEQDVVVTEVLPDGTARVTREDPLTGAARWTFRSTRPMRGPGGGPTWLYPFVQNGVIVANGPVTWAFAADGGVLGEWHLQGGDWAVRGGWGLDISVLPDGRFAVGESGGVGLSDERYGTVSTTDARDGFPIPGPVLQPVVDDGSLADVLFTVPAGRGGMVALDATTGERLWDLGNFEWGGALVLDGRMIAVVGRTLTAFDGRSGQQLWSAGVPMGNHAQQVLTDGRVVLVPMFDPKVGAVLTAFDPADGRRQWSAGLPAGANYLDVLDGRLVALTDRDLVALG